MQLVLWNPEDINSPVYDVETKESSGEKYSRNFVNSSCIVSTFLCYFRIFYVSLFLKTNDVYIFSTTE